VGEHGPVHALGRECVRVVDGGELLGGERLERPEHHVAGVVDDDVERRPLVEDAPDRRVHGLLVAHVELYGARALIAPKPLDVLDEPVVVAQAPRISSTTFG
jgi:hypothetical protein